MDHDRRSPKRGSLIRPILLVLGILALPLAPVLVVRAATAGICDSYNFISNDFCDEWNYEPPPAEALPVLAGWVVVWHDLSCGSGGCPDRVFVLTSAQEFENPAARYAARLRAMGWDVERGSNSQHYYFIGRKGNLVLSVAPAASESSIVPSRLREESHIEVSFALADEVGASYE
jgi:hypothetical protein